MTPRADNHEATSLTVENLAVSYGVGYAVRDVSISVRAAEIVAVLGANGAGKSTLLRTIMGLERPKAGDIRLGGESLVRAPTIGRVRSGLALVPEGRRIFTQLTVEVNLELSASPWRRWGESVAEDVGQIYGLFPVLGERRHRLASALSGGEQQMLAIGRALMARPKVLLLDEPTLGLAPAIVQLVMSTLRQLAERGIGVLIAEQSVEQVLRVADRGYVLANGSVAAEGAAQDLLVSRDLTVAYLGTENVGA
jgi:branched-chain amino acid transport system ATP-binding protein